MKLITERDIIRGVSNAWDRSKHRLWFNEDQKRMAISQRLSALDLDVATAAEVAEIMGTTTWTTLKCHECGNDNAKAVVQVGEEPDYGSCTAQLCFDCVAKAAAKCT